MGVGGYWERGSRDRRHALIQKTRLFQDQQWFGMGLTEHFLQTFFADDTHPQMISTSRGAF